MYEMEPDTGRAPWRGYVLPVLLLAAGGFAPVLSAGPGAAGARLAFPLHAALGGTWPAFIAAWLPVALALAVVLTLVLARGVARTVLMLVYALAAWTFAYAPASGGALLTNAPELFGGENPFLPVMGGFGLAAAVLVCAGNRARAVQPGNALAAATGPLAVACLALAVLHPFTPPAIGFMEPVVLMFEEEGNWAHQVTGFCRLLALMALTGAAIVAAINTPDLPGARDRARLANTAWWLHLAVLAAIPALVIGAAWLRDGVPPLEIGIDAANAARLAAVTLGLLFLAIAAAAGLIRETGRSG
jgi:hypothetical protein